MRIRCGELVNILSGNETPLVTLTGESGVYFLRPAMARALRRRNLRGKIGKKEDWLVPPLHPVKPLSEEFQKQWDEYLVSLETRYSA